MRGYRVEPEEIETVIRKSPRVRDAVVVAQENEAEDKHLVAYLVLDTRRPVSEDAVDSEDERQHVSNIAAVYDDLYTGQQYYSELDPLINLRVWTSRHTNGPLPEAEITENVNNTAQRIMLLRPRRVLDIGCGTGLIMSRVAPQAAFYYGTDISEPALILS